MKITKRPKRVDIYLQEVTRVIPSYTCPTCNVKFVGGNLDQTITRFKCSKCGQELIIDKFYIDNERKH